jgi:hypothetical protein
VGLTTLPPSCADCLEVWEPQPPGTLRACQEFALPFNVCTASQNGPPSLTVKPEAFRRLINRKFAINLPVSAYLHLTKFDVGMFYINL